jgi:hypothetical protein
VQSSLHLKDLEAIIHCSTSDRGKNFSLYRHVAEVEENSSRPGELDFETVAYRPAFAAPISAEPKTFMRTRWTRSLLQGSDLYLRS